MEFILSTKEKVDLRDNIYTMNEQEIVWLVNYFKEKNIFVNLLTTLGLFFKIR